MNSIYIHIPFCSSICSYCDFAKIYYNKLFTMDYLKELEKEIKNNYNNDVLKTIYIGGGTPSSLDLEELEYLFNILDSLIKDTNYEYTIECTLKDFDINNYSHYCSIKCRNGHKHTENTKTKISETLKNRFSKKIKHKRCPICGDYDCDKEFCNNGKMM